MDYQYIQEIHTNQEVLLDGVDAILKNKVLTANLRQWRVIFEQRTAKTAHPQIREVMQPLLDKIKTLIPVIFNDISYE